MLMAVEFVVAVPESALAETVSFAQPTYAHPFEVGVAVAVVEVAAVCVIKMLLLLDDVEEDVVGLDKGEVC
jgi:hypothetical protein